MNEIQISTDNCIQFVPREAQADFVEFSSINGLVDYLYVIEWCFVLYLKKNNICFSFQQSRSAHS